MFGHNIVLMQCEFQYPSSSCTACNRHVECRCRYSILNHKIAGIISRLCPSDMVPISVLPKWVLSYDTPKLGTNLFLGFPWSLGVFAFVSTVLEAQCWLPLSSHATPVQSLLAKHLTSNKNGSRAATCFKHWSPNKIASLSVGSVSSFHFCPLNLQQSQRLLE